MNRSSAGIAALLSLALVAWLLLETDDDSRAEAANSNDTIAGQDSKGSLSQASSDRPHPGAKPLETYSRERAASLKPNQKTAAKTPAPTTGSVVVRITDRAGNVLVLPNSPVTLGTGAWVSRCNPQGEIRFASVPLGRQWTAKVLDPLTEKSFAGPTYGGEKVVVNVVLHTNMAILTGRIVAENGDPIAGARMRLKLSYEFGGGEQILECNAAGRFQTALKTETQIIQHAVFRAVDARGELLRGSAVLHLPRPLADGATDLGDVVLEPQPILVSGQFLGVEEGRAWAQVERHQARMRAGRRVERWVPDDTMHMIRIGADRFEFRGEAQPGRRRLVATAQGYLPTEPVEFALGTEDLQITLQRGGSVAVSIAVDPGIQTGMLFQQLAAAGDEANEMRHPRLVSRGAGAVPGEARYRWVGLKPGVYRFRLKAFGQPRPLFDIPGIQVVGGKTTGDPRLQGLDLRGKLRLITVKVCDPEGKPIRLGSQSVLLPKPDGKVTQLEGRSFIRSRELGELQVALSGSSVDLQLFADGYPMKELLGVGQDTTVRLDPPKRIRVRLGGALPKLPKRRKLRVQISKQGGTEGPARTFRTEYRVGTLSSLHRSRSRVLHLAQGPASCTVPLAGVYQVHAMIEGGKARFQVLAVEPKTITVRDTTEVQDFVIRIPQEALDAALRK